MAKITVRQTGSPIRRKKDQRATLVGLGLNRIGRMSTLEDTPSVRGMIAKVAHMVRSGRRGRTGSARARASSFQQPSRASARRQISKERLT